GGLIQIFQRLLPACHLFFEYLAHLRGQIGVLELLLRVLDILLRHLAYAFLQAFAHDDGFANGDASPNGNVILIARKAVLAGKRVQRRHLAWKVCSAPAAMSKHAFKTILRFAHALETLLYFVI